jgi:hypothetical protein
MNRSESAKDKYDAVANVLVALAQDCESEGWSEAETLDVIRAFFAPLSQKINEYESYQLPE